MTRQRLGLVVHEGRAAAVEAAGIVRRWAVEHSVEVSDIDVWSPDAKDWKHCHRRTAVDEMAAAGHPALIVTVGGDGTFLRGARVAAEDNVPVLGINVGRVGFLTEVEPHEIGSALTAFFAGQVQLDERLMLTLRASRPLEIPEGMQALLRYGRGPLLPPPPLRPGSEPVDGSGVALDVTALNDVVFEKLARDRQASLGVYLDETLFASYSADALVVASPTGSTAYNFAAGGPILSPRLRALVFTPVAPHMVFNRSLVMAADEAVSIRVLEHSGQVAVSVDGQLRGVLNPGDWVTVLPAERPANLVRLRSSHFYSRLRERFSLTDAPAAIADSLPTG
ncbi:NAD(+)/NADH kinase [Micromonospora sp. NPDC049559]|uniref:NAD(+)/NADH kinase n=1 Tax=Micromonospora sp. NPDC049559 TaxID=3155923 RepID=UPI003449EDF6